MSGLGERESVGRGVIERPLNGLHVPSRDVITSEDLSQIFGIDCRMRTEDALAEMGLFGQGEKLKFLDRPQPHIYLKDGKRIESSALYFVDMIVGNDAVMASFVPPQCEATKHLHRFNITEHYRSIAGEAKLRMKEKAVRLGRFNRDFTVDEQSVHQFSTGSSPAFTLLIMRNARLAPRELWHEMSNEDVVID